MSREATPAVVIKRQSPRETDMSAGIRMKKTCKSYAER